LAEGKVVVPKPEMELSTVDVAAEDVAE